MKKSILILGLLVAVILPCQANQQKLEQALVLLADSLTSSYAGEPGVFKLNISIGEITNNTKLAAKLQIGQAVRETLLKIFSRSVTFSVIDRRMMDEVLKEQELQLSGLTEENNAVEIGSLMNAQAILYGSVSELGDTFVISCSLVNVETGETVSDQAVVPADIVKGAAEHRLDMMYVQPMGIGLSLSGAGVNVTGSDPTIVPFPDENKTIFRRNFSLEVRYRITSWLMAALGAEYVYGQLEHLDAVGLVPGFVFAYTTLYPTVTIPAAILVPGGTLPFNIVGEGFSIPIKLSYVYVPIRWLNLSLTLGATYHILDCSGYFAPSNGFGFGVNEYGPSIHREFFSANIMAGVELFLSPRAALSITAGYEYGVFELIGEEDTMIDAYLTGVPRPLDIDISGFTIAGRINLYF